MRIRLAAVDLDGTLLNSKKEIAPDDLRALHAAAEKGTVIVPATGRPFYGIPEEIRSLGYINYFITCNGAAIYDRNEYCLLESAMDTALSEELVRRLGELDISIDTYIGGRAYRSRSSMKMIDELELSDELKEFIRTTRVQVDDLPGYIVRNNSRVQKMTLNFKKAPDGTLTDRSNTAKLLSEYSDIEVVSGGERDLEITLKGVSKGSALKYLSELTGTPPEEIMAIGDSENDLAALKFAGTGVAPENSEQCVLDSAGFITLSNNDCGVAAAIRRFIIDPLTSKGDIS